MIPYAHSTRGGKPPQTYRDHVAGVVSAATRNVRNLSPHIGEARAEYYLKIVNPAAVYHDLGKLNPRNQEVLSGEKQAASLPVEHRDAGVAHLLGLYDEHPSATLVYAHHRPGFPNLIEQKTQPYPFRFMSALDDSDANLGNYLQLHAKAVGDSVNETEWTDPNPKLTSMEYRMLLSCLVDADYSDSAGKQPPPDLERRWPERLEKLNRYVQMLQEQSKEPDSERNKLRARLYDNCFNVATQESLVYCDSPVGTGKTTAVMAHMLKSAITNGLRHIFVVLPYTNIITQTVEVLREALVLDGENPEEIVAEHHHQADFENREFRHLATTWSAPIIITTAVQFFESLASNIPSKLRKLHQLPGSGIILDECHAALPITLMPLVWKWITELVEQWGCRFCLCSATLFKFWDTPIFRKVSAAKVVPLHEQKVSEDLNHFEKNRIKLNVWQQRVPHFKGVEELVQYLLKFHGSRVVVLNTVRSAAYLAKVMRDSDHDVLHLSTALTPKDRESVIREVQRRLDPNTQYDSDWTLVATSCIECGMNFSFQHGFCELRSLTSYLQLGGRVSRNGEYADSSLNVFTITANGFGNNPAFNHPRKVFLKQITSNLLKAGITQAVTQAFDLECREMGGLTDQLCKMERQHFFEDVAKNFRVIPEESVTVVADQELAGRISNGEEISITELQKGSVRLRRYIAKQLGCGDEELPILKGEQYDSFFGYMKTLI